jgi:hypothetical protein
MSFANAHLPQMVFIIIAEPLNLDKKNGKIVVDKSWRS